MTPHSSLLPFADRAFLIASFVALCLGARLVRMMSRPAG